MENKMQDSKRDISQILIDFGIYNQSGIASMRLDKELREYFASEISKAKEEILKGTYDFVEKESGKTGRKEILKYLESELDKLSNKRE